MKLYEFGPTRSVRVRWVLQELDVPFESVPVNLMAGDHRQPGYLQVNPAGKVPAFEDDGRVLTESAAIMLYLADRFPEKGLVPVDLWERAQMHRWLFFGVTELEQPLWRIARHRSLYPEAKRLPAEVELARGDFGPMAAVLEQHMHNREFVVSDRVTVADILLAYTLDWASMYGMLKDFPKLADYVDRMYARSAAPIRMAAAFAAMN